MSWRAELRGATLSGVKLLLLFLLLSLSALAESGGVALVVEVRGTVAGVQLLDSVPMNRKLRVPGGAHVTLSFLEGGKRTRCQGPGVFLVEAAGVRRLQGTGGVDVQQPRSVVAREIRGSFNWDKMAGVRHRDLGWLVDETLLEPLAVLRWQAEPAVSEVQVTIEELPDFRRLLRQTLPNSAGQVTVTLQPGRTYELELTAYAPGAPPSEAARQQVRVLGAGEATRLLELEKQATTPEELLEMCSVWLQHGVRSRASLLARRLLTRYPDSQRLQDLAQP
jgi:hypothetical protein